MSQMLLGILAAFAVSVPAIAADRTGTIPQIEGFKKGANVYLAEANSRPPPKAQITRPKSPRVQLGRASLKPRSAFKQAAGNATVVSKGRGSFFTPASGNPKADILRGATLVDRTQLLRSKRTFDKNVSKDTSKSRSRTDNTSFHYNKHGGDFGARNPTQYAKKARSFRNNPPKGSLQRNLPDGRKVLYHPNTNTLMVVKSNGRIGTFYKPKPKSDNHSSGYDKRYKNPMDYFIRGFN
ncbi:hypothetical protein [Amaricoccus sp. W119]|uniref:hypothetical protein n=1 Tax=Amaricoccus sp. W119 TaxID=3391833 RepID=UPI0039A521F2